MKRKKIIGTMAAILILLIVGAVAVVLVRRPFDAGKPDELLADYFACIEKGAYDKMYGMLDERRAQDRATGSVAALDMVPTAVRYAGR